MRAVVIKQRESVRDGHEARIGFARVLVRGLDNIKSADFVVGTTTDTHSKQGDFDCFLRKNLCNLRSKNTNPEGAERVFKGVPKL